jgi:hypothetical protein
MYQIDPTTEAQIARLRQERLDSQIALLRLVSDDGVVEQPLPIRLIRRIGNYLARSENRSSETSSRAA